MKTLSRTLIAVGFAIAATVTVVSVVGFVGVGDAMACIIGVDC